MKIREHPLAQLVFLPVMFFLGKEVICVLPHWIRRRFHRSHINLLRLLGLTAGGRTLPWLNKRQQHITLFPRNRIVKAPTSHTLSLH